MFNETGYKMIIYKYYKLYYEICLIYKPDIYYKTQLENIIIHKKNRSFT